MVPGIFAMIDGWLNECVNLVTVIFEFADAMLVTWLKSQVEAWVP